MLGTKVSRSFALVGALLIIVVLAAAACGGDTDAPAAPALTEAQLRSIVEDAVSKSMPAPQQQVSAAEIQSMVAEAMRDASSSQVSASEIQSMVEAAVASAAAEGATPEEIQTMVRSAVDAATADSVTGSDVQSAISMAVTEAQKSAVTTQDVQSAVSMAVMEAQEGAVTTEDVNAAVSSAVMQAASNSLTPEQIQAIVSQALDERAAMEELPKTTIVFSDLNWTSAQVQNRIAQYIVEHGYGYRTDTILGSTLPNFQGLQKGDIDVTLEIWLPNQSIGWSKAVELGEVVSLGIGGLVDWQSYFIVPRYVVDDNPDLKTVQDLKKPEYRELFSTADSRDRARLVGCVIGWSCETVGIAQIEAYGLSDYIHIINPGSQQAMFADINGAYEKREPWLGYMWGTGDPGILLDLVRLEEPPYTEECWGDNMGCAFSDSQVLKAVHKSLLARAPDVIQMLQNWSFDVPTYRTIFSWMNANPGSEASDAARWFLNNNTVWQSWVTPEAAARINAALEDES